MQPQVDDEFLKAIGLTGLSEEEKEKALDDILFTLNMNVANRVADSLSDEQMDELEKLTENDKMTDDELAAWLSKNVPNYSQLIEEEAQKMKDFSNGLVDQVMGEKAQ